MELSETIKKLKDYKLHGYTKFFLKNNMDRLATKLEIEEMIDTILKTLDNSISKDEVKKVLERENKKYNEAVNDVYKNPANALVDFQRVCGKREVLKELLGE